MMAVVALKDLARLDLAVGRVTALWALEAGDDYRVTVDLQAIRRPDQEVWVQTGTMTVETEQGKTVVQDVYGVCAC